MSPYSWRNSVQSPADWDHMHSSSSPVGHSPTTPMATPMATPHLSPTPYISRPKSTEIIPQYSLEDENLMSTFVKLEAQSRQEVPMSHAVIAGIQVKTFLF